MRPVHRRIPLGKIVGTLAVAWFLAAGRPDAAAAAVAVPSSHPNQLVAVKETLFFVADDGIHGRELWAWHPAPENPDGICGLVIDLVPGPKGSEPSGLSNCGGWLYFKAVASSSEAMFYQCNPDTLAVETIKDAQGMPVSAQEAQTPHLVAPDGKTFFCLSYTVENVNPSGDKSNPTTAWLWRGTCGTPTLTPLLALPELCRAGPHEYCLLDEKTLLLSCKGYILALDGASGNSHKIKIGRTEEDSGFFGISKIIAGEAAFLGSTPETGLDLWLTDGTQQGTRLVKDIAPGGASSGIRELCPLGKETLLFAATDDIHGLELWRTDGAPDGTELVKDINPGVAQSDPYNFHSVGDDVYFVADDGIHGVEPWRTDGTPEGTRMLLDAYTGSKGSNPWEIESENGLLYFCATSSLYGEEVFVSDGTSAGTRVLADIVRGNAGSGPDNLCTLSGRVFFSCDEPVYGEELWMSDGTAAGTRLVMDIYPALPNPSSSPREVTALGEKVCFVASSPGHGKELWLSDGTDAGTGMIRDIAPGAGDATPRQLTSAGDRIFFTANDQSHGEELWVTDGTEDGTVLLCDFWPGGESSTPEHLFVTADGLYFTADDGQTGREPLFVSRNGGLPVLLGDLVPGPVGAESAGFFDIEGRVYGYFRETGSFMGLWRFMPDTELTAVAVKRVPYPAPIWEPGTLPPGELIHTSVTCFSERDVLLAGLLYPPTGDDSGPQPVWMDHYAYFCLYTDAYGAELWRSNGTLEQTLLVRDCNPGPASSSPAQLCVLKDILYFVAEDYTNTRVVWRSDGSKDGTSVIHPQIDFETYDAIAAMELQVQGTLWVAARSLISGQDYPCLIRIKANAKYSFEDFNPKPHVFIPRQLTVAGKRIFFTADDGIHGEELWTSQGNIIENTVMVKDILTPVEQEALIQEGR
ncbi:MAG TPA: hypothetical protein PKO23_17535 [Candidatus Hydrogenedentes bacterium]|nr:hypothetical protein [Candidatus Hydrogenedentota bacterium]